MIKKPNIILILADDMGYGDFGKFSEGRTKTEALDYLAGEGVCLSQHYSASTVCAPARAALLTGRYPHRTGAVDTIEARGLDRIALRERTMADCFNEAGYSTGLIGKWHNGAFDKRFHPNKRGFKEFCGFCGGWQDYWEWALDYNGRLEKSDGRYLTDVFTEEALAFINRHKTEPFFLHLSYNAPHFPLQCPKEDIAVFAESRNTPEVNTVYGMIHRMDKGILKILETLEKLKLTENTIVLFSSDNGPHLKGKLERWNCNLAGAKTTVYEGGIRVPMIMRWPAGGLTDGRECREFVHFTDWLPTLCAGALIKDRKDLPLDGENILDVLQEKRQRSDSHHFWQWNRYTPNIETNAAFRDGNWKLLRPLIAESIALHGNDGEIDRESKKHPHDFSLITEPVPEYRVNTPSNLELYNLDMDPCESHNLVSEEADRVHRMNGELENWFEEVMKEWNESVKLNLN